MSSGDGMTTGNGFTEFMQTEGIIAGIYAGFITLVILARRRRERGARRAVETWLQDATTTREVLCNRCWREVPQLYRIGVFGPYCYGCCANFAYASGREVRLITPATRTENMT